MEMTQKSGCNSIYEGLLTLGTRSFAFDFLSPVITPTQTSPSIMSSVNGSRSSSHNHKRERARVQKIFPLDHHHHQNHNTNTTTADDQNSSEDRELTLASLVEHLKTKMKYKDVSDVKVILERKLTETDVNDTQARLAIPTKQLLASFLYHCEDWYLTLKDANNNNIKMPVKVIIGDKEYTLSLARWNYYDKNKGKNDDNGNNAKADAGWKYVLNNGWTQLKNENRLKQGDLIKIVTFRSNHVIHFAINAPRPQVPQLLDLFH